MVVCDPVVEVCWQLTTMWAAQHCGVLFLLTLNKWLFFIVYLVRRCGSWLYSISTCTLGFHRIDGWLPMLHNIGLNQHKAHSFRSFSYTPSAEGWPTQHNHRRLPRQGNVRGRLHMSLEKKASFYYMIPSHDTMNSPRAVLSGRLKHKLLFRLA